MAEPIVLGAQGMTIIGRRYGWNRRFGQTETVVYEGSHAAAISAQAIFRATANVDDVQMSTAGGNGRLRVLYVDGTLDEVPATEENSFIWELAGQDLWRNARAHPTFNKDADQADLEEVRAAIESANPDFEPAADSTAELYYKLLLRNTTEYLRSTAILTQSITAGPRTTITANWNNVDAAITIAGTGVTQSGQAAIIGSVADMPDADPQKKQWLKRAPRITSDNHNRQTLQYRYFFAYRWSHTFYDGDEENGNP